MPSLPITGWIHPLPTMTFDLADAIDATTSGDCSPLVRSPEGQQVRVFTEMFPAAQRYIQEHFIKMGDVWINPRVLQLASSRGGVLSIATRHGRWVYPPGTSVGYPTDRLAKAAGMAQIGQQAYVNLGEVSLFMGAAGLHLGDQVVRIGAAYVDSIRQTVAAAWMRMGRIDGYINPSTLVMLTPHWAKYADGASLPFHAPASPLKAQIRKAIPWLPVSRKCSINPAQVAEVQDHAILFKGKVPRLVITPRIANRVRGILQHAQ